MKKVLINHILEKNLILMVLELFAILQSIFHAKMETHSSTTISHKVRDRGSYDSSKNRAGKGVLASTGQN